MPIPIAQNALPFNQNWLNDPSSLVSYNLLLGTSNAYSSIVQEVYFGLPVGPIYLASIGSAETSGTNLIQLKGYALPLASEETHGINLVILRSYLNSLLTEEVHGTHLSKLSSYGIGSDQSGGSGTSTTKLFSYLSSIQSALAFGTGTFQLITSPSTFTPTTDKGNVYNVLVPGIMNKNTPHVNDIHVPRVISRRIPDKIGGVPTKVVRNIPRKI